MSSNCFSQPVTPTTEITEEDLSPSVFPYQIRFPNGTLTDNLDGTVSFTATFAGDLKTCGDFYLSGDAFFYQSDLLVTDSVLGSVLTFDPTTGNLVIVGTLNSGAITTSGVTSRVTGQFGEYIDFDVNGSIGLSSLGGTDDTDIFFDLDGGHPVIYSCADDVIGFGDPIWVCGDSRFSGSLSVLGGICVSESISLVDDLYVGDDAFISGALIVGGTTPDSLFEVDGAEGLAVETVTGNTTLNNTHSTLLVNASGNVTITLPTAASSYNNTDGIGRIYTIKKIDADADVVTIDGNGTETIDGDQTPDLTAQYQAIVIQSDGSNWHILSDIS